MSRLFCFAVFFVGEAPAADTARPATATMAVAIRAMRLDTQRLPCIRLQGPPQPVLEADLRLPAQQLLGSCDVWLSDFRVVNRQCLEDDLAVAAGRLEHLLGELEKR